MVLNIVAFVTPAPGKEARVEEILVDLASKVQQEESDTLRYQPYKQTGDGATSDYVVIERYKDLASLKAHMSTSYFAEIEKEIGEKGLLAKPLHIIQLAPLSSGFDSR